MSIKPSAKVSESHSEAVRLFGEAGTWLNAEDRTAIWTEARHATHCKLCLASKQALSPYTLKGDHDTATGLPANLVEIVHRIKNDSGRLTKRWFDKQLDTGLSREAYVETLSLVATSIILDSFAGAMGLPDYVIPEPVTGEPTRITNPDVVDEGAWLPLTKAEQKVEDHGLPNVPNIARAMGMVPSGMMHFFGDMRAHYSLSGDDFGINRSQVELIAARVSSHNACFY